MPAGDDRWRALGWDEQWARDLARLTGTPARIGRVDRGWLRLLHRDGATSAPQPTDGLAPVTGDWVSFTADADQIRVTAVAPRRSALVRRAPADATGGVDREAGGDPRPQVLAANMDAVWVMHAVDQPLRAGWLDRALVMAYGSSADVLVVVTKGDLAGADDVAGRIRALAPHVPMLTTSSQEGHNVAALLARLAGGRCTALLGRSGSGKSSLINALLGTRVHRTADVRDGDARGRHTTTRRSLQVVDGGSVIDTPGVRALGLWEPTDGMARAFPDIADLAAACRFRDCSHRGEPGCEVLAARADGRLGDDRYRRFMTLRE